MALHCTWPCRWGPQALRSVCSRILAAPKVCTMGVKRGKKKKKKKKKEAEGKAADGRARKEGKEERQRRGSGGRAPPANHRRAPELQKPELPSPGLAGARSPRLGSARLRAESGALGGPEPRCREHQESPLCASHKLSSFPPVRASQPR